MNRKEIINFIIIIITAICVLLFAYIAINEEKNFDQEKIVTTECKVVDLYRKDTIYNLEVVSTTNNKWDEIRVNEEEAKNYTIGEIYEFYTLDYRNYYVDKASLIGGHVTGGYYLLSLISLVLFIIFVVRYINIRKKSY